MLLSFCRTTVCQHLYMSKCCFFRAHTQKYEFLHPCFKKTLALLHLAASCPDAHSKNLLFPSFLKWLYGTVQSEQHNADNICANQSGTATNGLIIIPHPFASFHLSYVFYMLRMEMKDCK